MSRNPGQPQKSPPGMVPPQGTVTLTIVAIVMGFLAVVVTNMYIADSRAQVRAQVKTYYRFNKELPVGRVIDVAKDLEPVQIPAGFEDAFPGAVEDTSQYEGGILTRRVTDRQVLRQDMFTSAGGTEIGPIPDGHVVKTIRVDRINLSTTIQRNGYVDVYAVFKQEGSDVARKVLNRVQILHRGNNRVDILLPMGVERQVMAIQSFYGFQHQKGFELVALPMTGERTDWIGEGVNPVVLKMIGFK
jgi:hypothetical protein